MSNSWKKLIGCRFVKYSNGIENYLIIKWIIINFLSITPIIFITVEINVVWDLFFLHKNHVF